MADLDAIESELQAANRVAAQESTDGYVDVDTSPRSARASASPRHGHPYWIEGDAQTEQPTRGFQESSSATRRGYMRAPAGESAVARLRAAVPYLSPSFTCSDDDAELMLTYVVPASHQQPNASALEDKVVQLECDVKLLTGRLQRRTDEVARLKDDVAEARQKQRAVEAQSKQTATVLGQRREETRKQLLSEESRNSKLQFQNRTLHAEVEKLKERVHQLLSR